MKLSPTKATASVVLMAEAATSRASALSTPPPVNPKLVVASSLKAKCPCELRGDDVPAVGCGTQHNDDDYHHSSHNNESSKQPKGDKDRRRPQNVNAAGEKNSVSQLDKDPLSLSKHQQPSIICPNDEVDGSLYSSTHLDAWSQLKMNRLIWNRSGVFEYHLAWNADDNEIDVVAQKVADEIKPWFQKNKDAQDKRLSDILSNIAAFTSFCSTHLNPSAIQGYKIGVSAMHGDSATRCPAFHADHVPVRSIQTLFGPGTKYIDPEFYSHDERLQDVLGSVPPPHLANHPKWKETIVQSSCVEPMAAEPGQTLFFVGRMWSEVCKPMYAGRQGVLHRSPHNVDKNQGRVLMTLDVTVHEHDEQCDGGCCKD